MIIGVVALALVGILVEGLDGLMQTGYVLLATIAIPLLTAAR